MSVLAIDAGTTGVTALIITEDGSVAGRGYREFRQFFPNPGWVEHLPEGIWQAALGACTDALDAAGSGAAGSAAADIAAADIAAAGSAAAGAGIAASGRTAWPAVSCIGITNQRETAVIWDRATLAAPRRAIVWQDRRTAGICAELRDQGHEDQVRAVTGLRLDPYFTATKLTWLARNDPAVWAGVADGSLAVGTVDSYLIARLTGGRRHVTDASNASRTLLFDLEAGQWSGPMCQLFGVPLHALPEVIPSTGIAGHTDPAAFLGLGLPVAGLAGDQQAALFGQACFAAGASKCTYGTGSFVLCNTGTTIVRSQSGLLSTVAWLDGSGATTYALEGSVFVTGAAVQWLRDGLGLLDNASQSEVLARSVPDSGGVVFVPALTGLGAPDWDPDARGAVFGLTRGTTRAHLVRATLEAIAFQVRDVADLISAEIRPGEIRPGEIRPGEARAVRVDGGASANDLLLQLQADQLQAPVERPVVAETTALGAAFLAGLATGVWSSPAELAATWRLDRRFEPGRRDESAHARWRSAVDRTKGWAS
jgi:glycerol kinase